MRRTPRRLEEWIRSTCTIDVYRDPYPPYTYRYNTLMKARIPCSVLYGWYIYHLWPPAGFLLPLLVHSSSPPQYHASHLISQRPPPPSTPCQPMFPSRGCTHCRDACLHVLSLFLMTASTAPRASGPISCSFFSAVSASDACHDPPSLQRRVKETGRFPPSVQAAHGMIRLACDSQLLRRVASYSILLRLFQRGRHVRSSINYCPTPACYEFVASTVNAVVYVVDWTINKHWQCAHSNPPLMQGCRQNSLVVTTGTNITKSVFD
jgi:hypothetical protein